jgi:tight adherence protein C
MPLVPTLGALTVVAAMALLWWALAGGASASPAATRNLTAGWSGLPLDSRRRLLARPTGERVVGPAARSAAGLARRLTPAGVLAGLERRVLLAGAPAAWPLERVLATKVVLGGAAAAFAALRFAGAPGAGRVLLGLAGTAFGFLLPDILLSNVASKRQVAIERALPDTLDQMTISVEAGLTFDAAVARAARSGDGPLNGELSRTMQDVQAGLSRAEAFSSLLERTRVDDLRHFVLAVIQADRHGVSVARVLRVQADEMRIKRRQRAEEAAMKLPVKILFPLVVFILPTLFIVLLGPAVLRAAQTL